MLGRGSLERLPELCKQLGKSVLLVTGRKAMKEIGVLEKIVKMLREKNITCIIFDEVAPEPTIEFVDRGVEIATKNNIEVIVGLGGGSAIDCGKAIAGVAGKNRSVRDFLAGLPLDSPGLPYIAIPTTAGTGAEVTPNAVLIDSDRKVKESFRSSHLFPKAAIIDPELTLTLSPKYTAYTGMDALCHAIESYVSLGANPLTDALAYRAAELIGESLVEVYKYGSKIELREKMLYGSLFAGIALFNARLGLVHGIAHPLGFLYKLFHGLLCGVLLPYAMSYNLEVVNNKYRSIAKALGENVDGLGAIEGGRLAIAKVQKIMHELDFPNKLSELGVKKEDFPKIIKDSMPSGSLRANPRKVTEKDVEDVLNQAF